MSLYEDDDEAHDDGDDYGLGEVLAGLWVWVRPHRLSAALLLACLTAHLASTLAIALSLERIVDDVVPNGDGALLAEVVGLMLGVIVLAFLVSILQARIVARLSARVLVDIQKALFEHVMRVPHDYFRRTERGDVLARFSSDIAAIAAAVGEAGPFLAMYALMLIGCIGAITWIDWRAGLATLLLLPLGALLHKVVGTPAARAIRDYRAREGEVLSVAEEAVRSHLAIRGYGLYPFFRGRFRERAERKAARHVRASFLVNLGEMVVEYGAMLLGALALAGGAWLAIAGHMSAGALVAMFTLLLYMQDAAYEIGTTAAKLIEAGGGLERVQTFLSEPAEDADDPDRAAPPLAREIRFEQVDFAYAPDRPIFDGVSFAIRRGETVALVGRSGSGKSTALMLLLRFLDPCAGRVLWDGADVTALSRRSLRAEMGVVFQEPLSVRATVAEAVRFGRADASDGEVAAALRAAALDDVVAGLPQGLDTLIGEGGQEISGGQRQRLALAQALVRRPSLLLLDEATSALDPETEAQIAETLEALPAEQTMLFVTHRMSLASRADRIVVLADGMVVENGSHAELMQADGRYARMYERQAGFEVAPNGDVAISTDCLRLIPILSELSEDHLATLADAFVTARYEAGAVIVREGDRADAFYVIYRGRLEARVRDDVVAVLEDGDHFGEVALVLNLPRTASVIARSPTICLRLPCEAFASLLGSSAALEQKLVMAARHRLEAVQAFTSTRTPDAHDDEPAVT